MQVSKSLVRTMYDLQHERIQTGNRICAEIKARLGQRPGMSETELEKEAKKYLEAARKEFKRITDGFVLTNAAKYLKANFEGCEIITDAGMLTFVDLYDKQLENEEKMVKVIGKIVEQHPMWEAFLHGVRGCGPLMSAVVLSEFDPAKADDVSKFWKYAGLDVVRRFYLKERKHDDAPEMVETRHPVGYKTKGPRFIGNGDVFALEDEKTGELMGTYGLDLSKPGEGAGRSRKAEHLVDVEYTDKDGKMQTKKSITFNPFLKTKLVGVLAASFVKDVEWSACDMGLYEATSEERRKMKKVDGEEVPHIIIREGKYRSIYSDYKRRLECHEKYGVEHDADRIAEMKKTSGKKYSPKLHRHNMAIRYCVKMFVADLWLAWRKIEGLPITAPYCEAVLRGRVGGIMERQHDYVIAIKKPKIR